MQLFEQLGSLSWKIFFWMSKQDEIKEDFLNKIVRLDN